MNATEKKDKMITINEIAKLVEGTVSGDGTVRIKGISASDHAGEGDMTFALNDENLKRAGESNASCVMVTRQTANYPKTTVCVNDMKLAMTILYNAMAEISPPQGGSIHLTSVIGKNVNLGKNASIGAFAVIGENAQIGENTRIGDGCNIGKNVRIGNNVRVYPNVTIYADIVIHNKVIIHSGTVIGADGFGYLPMGAKTYKVPQLGTVIIEDNVEIGANTCIDRGTFKNTIIGKGTKLDNLVQVAHNVELGENIMAAAQTGIAGSTTVGANTLIGGQAGISDNISIGKNVKIGAKTAVHGSVEDDLVIWGYPYREAGDAKKLHGLFSIFLKNMKKIRKLIRELPE